VKEYEYKAPASQQCGTMKLLFGRPMTGRFMPSHMASYAPILAAALLAALVDVLSKPIVATQGSGSAASFPLVMAAMMYGVVGLGFAPLTRKRVPKPSINRKSKFLIIACGVLEAAARVTFLFGLRESTAVKASILQHSEFIFAIIIAMTLFRESLRKQELVPFGVIVLGVIVLPIATDILRQNADLTQWVWGDLLILLSGLFYAASSNLCKFVDRSVSAYRVTQLESLVSAVAILAVIGVLGLPLWVDPVLIVPILLLGLATGVSTILFVVSLRLIGASRTVLMYATTSGFGVAFSGMILHEVVSPLDVTSVILILFGIYLLRNRLTDQQRGSGVGMLAVPTVAC